MLDETKTKLAQTQAKLDTLEFEIRSKQRQIENLKTELKQQQFYFQKFGKEAREIIESKEGQIAKLKEDLEEASN